MLKVFKLLYKYHENFYEISPLSGDLLQFSNHTRRNVVNIPYQVTNALKFCDNPYLCQYPNVAYFNNDEKFLKIKSFHKNFMNLGNRNYFLTMLYSSLRKPLFENTVEAFSYISKIPEQVNNGNKLCLQRSFMALKTSKSFQENKGVLFIGALLPSGTMHAWIIEKGFQPDIPDRDWILYKPLLAYYYE
jgi:hypothetical protein